MSPRECTTTYLVKYIRMEIKEAHFPLMHTPYSLVDYDESDLIMLRDKCLDWQDRFVNRLDQRRYVEYLEQAPSRTDGGLYERPAKELSK